MVRAVFSPFITYLLSISVYFLLLSAQGKYGDLDSSLISFGPCQTPTLGFCVDRHDKIQSFKPETYWTLDVYVQPSSGGASFALDWGRVRTFDMEVGSTFLGLINAVCCYRSVCVV